MENTIKETTRLLLQGNLTKDEADKILLDLLVVSKRSELLKVFHSFLEWHRNMGFVSIRKSDFDEYLKTFNCC